MYLELFRNGYRSVEEFKKHNKVQKSLKKISRRISSNDFMPIHLLHSKKVNQSMVNFMLLLSCLPKMDKNDTNFKHLVKKENLKNSFGHIKQMFQKRKDKKGKSTFDYCWDILSQKTNMIKHIDDKISFIQNDFIKQFKTYFPHQNLFSILVDEDLLADYNYDITSLRKDVAFATLIEILTKCNNEVILSKNIVEEIFGLTNYDINKYCETYNIEKITKSRDLGYLEKQNLEIETNLTERASKIRIGYILQGQFDTIKQKLNNKLQNKLNINELSLATVKFRLEEKKHYYSIESFEKDLSRLGNQVHPKHIWNFKYVGNGLFYRAYSNSQKIMEKVKSYIEMNDFGTYKQRITIRKSVTNWNIKGLWSEMIEEICHVSNEIFQQ